MTNRRIVVMGSVHMDLIASAARLPGVGESVSGGSFSMAPGGKAGNQASLFAGLGAHVWMVARLGDDLFGHQLLASLRQHGVDTSLASIDEEHSTGASTVLVADGDYSSIIAPGASGELAKADIDRSVVVISDADALVLQLELPLPVTDYAAQVAHELGTRVILNASPVPDVIDGELTSLLQMADILFVNRVEAARLLGRTKSDEAAESLTTGLSERFGIETVVVTLGGEGSVAYTSTAGVVMQGSFPANVVDTVGAGDAFLAATSLALIEGQALDLSLKRGSAAGAMLVSRVGVSGKLPTQRDIGLFLESAESV